MLEIALLNLAKWVISVKPLKQLRSVLLRRFLKFKNRISSEDLYNLHLQPR